MRAYTENHRSHVCQPALPACLLARTNSELRKKKWNKYTHTHTECDLPVLLLFFFSLLFGLLPYYVRRTRIKFYALLRMGMSVYGFCCYCVDLIKLNQILSVILWYLFGHTHKFTNFIGTVAVVAAPAAIMILLACFGTSLLILILFYSKMIVVIFIGLSLRTS